MSQLQPAAADTDGMESFVYDDAVVRKFMTASFVWGFVAMLVGVIIALDLVLPTLAEQMPFLRFFYETEWLTFGRLRPLHTNAAIFAFAGNAMFAAIYYSTQRLCKARMFSDKLSAVHFWGWQGIIVSAALTLPLGITSGKEYAELEWPIDIAITLVWVVFAVNFFGTLVRRRERHMYVALWFYIATIITVAILHIFNSLAIPASLFKSYSIYAGVQDAFMQWWYGHNAVAFFLTTPFLGLMYYFLPKAADKPVFSYRLSIVHFWSLVFLYIWAGPHHLHYTALPAWASTLGMLFSVMLWMPSWGGMINGLLTLRGAWHKVTQDPVLKFFVVGITFYGMSTFEGPLLSIKSINSLSHYTDWTIGHVHSGTLGWNGFMIFGMFYFLLPRLFQTELWSKKLANWHFWVGTLGILAYIIPMYAAGITQGLMWRAFDEVGSLKFPNFIETVMTLMPFYWIRVLGGLLYLAGVVICGVNFYMTWRSRPPKYDEPVQKAAPLSPRYVDPAIPSSRLHANVKLGHKGDVFLQGNWHRKWERRPLRFTIWVVIAVVVASLFEIIPTIIMPAFSKSFKERDIPTIATVTPYTPLELYGRDIYIAEGCYNCHSQMVRPLYSEDQRYGEYSKAGEFVYDHPFQWGSRRIGPDLHRLNQKSKPTSIWHYNHFSDPRSLVNQSIMPAYKHLLTQTIDFEAIQKRVQVMAMLGVPYGDYVEGTNASDHARNQAKVYSFDLMAQGGPPGTADKKVIALIAYLNRLGTDIDKTPTEPTEE